MNQMELCEIPKFTGRAFDFYDHFGEIMTGQKEKKKLESLLNEMSWDMQSKARQYSPDPR